MLYITPVILGIPVIAVLSIICMIYIDCYYCYYLSNNLGNVYSYILLVIITI